MNMGILPCARHAKKPEVLSPAGDMQRLRSALRYGADAVYLAGQQFGMRASPDNFSLEEIEEAVTLCHRQGANVYVTLNTLPRNDEIAHLPDFIMHCKKAGVDAFIVADFGVLHLVRQYAKDMPFHISTQAGIVNYASANAFYEAGASRIVLAREVTLDEIRIIREKTPASLEIEAFVHGAMCMSVSGRCLLSNYMTGRDANRGACAQPCRWSYVLTETKRPHEYYEIGEGDGGSYILNAKDLCMIDYLPQLIAAGVDSLKIEGRAKSDYYVASVTSAYRRAVDFLADHPNEPLPDSVIYETEKTSHRPYSTGFYLGGQPGQETDSGGYIRHYDVVAVCIGRKDDFLVLKQRNKFVRGAVADVLIPGKTPIALPLFELFDQDLSPLESAPHAEMTVLVKTDVDIPVGSFFRVKR